MHAAPFKPTFCKIHGLPFVFCVPSKDYPCLRSYWSQPSKQCCPCFSYLFCLGLRKFVFQQIENLATNKKVGCPLKCGSPHGIFGTYILFNKGIAPSCAVTFFFALFGVKMVFMLLTHMCCIAPLGIIWRHLTLARWSTGHVVCRFCKSGCTASEACGFLTCTRLAQAHWCTFLCQV